MTPIYLSRAQKSWTAGKGVFTYAVQKPKIAEEKINDFSNRWENPATLF